MVAEPFTTPDATVLRRAYYAEVAGRYWKRSVTEAEIDQGMLDFPADELAPPTGQFVVGRLDGRALACGGIRLLDPATAELTRVYVDRRARGTGGGAALLAALEGGRPRAGRRADAPGHPYGPGGGPRPVRAPRIPGDTRVQLRAVRPALVREGPLTRWRPRPSERSGPGAAARRRAPRRRIRRAPG
ncbi:acetyltransferase [Streptomyces sp. C]|nr:acetyltransferase [Streptomyces sp. C]